MVSPKLSFSAAMGAATNVVYAFTGQWMYFELMDTMAVPEDFPKVFLITGPFTLLIYLAVALLGYGFGAGNMDLVASMPHGMPLRVTAAMLFVHVVIVYLIRSVVLSRFFHHLCHPQDVEERTVASYFRHGGWSVAMLTFSYLIANSVPFFSQLLGLIGGLLAGPINFLLPIMLFLVAKGRGLQLGLGEPETMRTYQAPPQQVSKQVPPTILGVDDEAAARGRDTEPCCGGGSDNERSGDEESKTREVKVDKMASGDLSCFQLACQGLLSLPYWEQLLLTMTALFIVVVMLVGVFDQVEQVLQLEDKLGKPFSCHLLEPPAAPTC